MARTRARTCLTDGCPGAVKHIKTKTHRSCIRRRWACKICGLRWATLEKTQVNSVLATGPYGLEQAAAQLSRWREKQPAKSADTAVSEKRGLYTDPNPDILRND